MKYEGVSFNEESIKKHKTAESFMNSVGVQHLWPKASVTVRKQRLKELYNLVTKNANSKRLPGFTSKDKSSV